MARRTRGGGSLKRPSDLSSATHTVTVRRVRRPLESSAPLVAWAAAAICLFAPLAAGLLAIGDGSLPWKLLVMPVVWAVPGALIAAGRPRIAVGWLMLGVALLFAGASLSDRWVAHAGAGGVGIGWAAWFIDRGAAWLTVLGLLALLLLPDGRLPSRRWRPWVGTLVAIQCAVLTTWCLARGPAAAPDSGQPAAVLDEPNPLGLLPSTWGDAISGLDVVALQLPLLLVPVAFAVRLRRADGEERPRLVGVVLAATVFVVLAVTGHTLWPSLADVLDVIGSVFLGAVLVATVLRRRLAQVDVVVHVTFVYAVLTLVIAGAYVVAIAATARIGADLSPFGAGVVVAVLALALHPLRGRLQRWVERLLHGDRGDPGAALRRLADHTHAAPGVDTVLAELAATVAVSLRAPWARIEAGGHAAEHGRRPSAGATTDVPMTVGAGRSGSVSVVAGAGRRLGRGEHRLLGDLARHGGIAVRAVLLAEDLLASRQELVTTREEERRCLRRDLHDELGPTLAGLSMQLGTVRGLLPTDPILAAQRLIRLQEASDEALAHVRRVARGLRPPALDDRGLQGAVRHQAEALGLVLRLDVGELPILPAAVEVAAYRIAVEALSNVARHAGTVHARVSLAADRGGLTVTVADDGSGLSGSVTGVGLLAMRERADELGGSLSVAAEPGAGTVVTAVLPLVAARQEARP